MKNQISKTNSPQTRNSSSLVSLFQSINETMRNLNSAEDLELKMQGDKKSVRISTKAKVQSLVLIERKI